MKIKILFLIIFFISTAGPTQAMEISEKIQNHYQKTESFQADFIQILSNAATREQEERMGSIAFQKPLNIRWESTDPEPELLIINEQTMWNYFPEENALYQYETDDIITSRTMLRFISGQAMLKDDFNIEDQGMEDGLHKIKLVPKNPEPDLVLAYIWADDQGVMNRILVVDFFGNGNELRLKNIDLNPDFEPDTFNFDPPEGVEIIEN